MDLKKLSKKHLIVISSSALALILGGTGYYLIHASKAEEKKNLFTLKEVPQPATLQASSTLPPALQASPPQTPSVASAPAPNSETPKAIPPAVVAVVTTPPEIPQSLKVEKATPSNVAVSPAPTTPHQVKKPSENVKKPVRKQEETVAQTPVAPTVAPQPRAKAWYE